MTAAVAGIDLAVGGTGYAGPDGRSWLLSERASLGPYERISRIAVRLDRLIGDHEPELVVLEGYGAGGPGRSSMVRGIELGGVVRVDLLRRFARWIEVAPTTLKAYAAGHGRADKTRMAAALESRLYLSAAELSDDEVDALWLRDVGLWLLDDPAAAGPDPATSSDVVDGLLDRTRPTLVAIGRGTREGT